MFCDQEKNCGSYPGFAGDPMGLKTISSFPWVLQCFSTIENCIKNVFLKKTMSVVQFPCFIRVMVKNCIVFFFFFLVKLFSGVLTLKEQSDVRFTLFIYLCLTIAQSCVSPATSTVYPISLTWLGLTLRHGFQALSKGAAC